MQKQIALVLAIVLIPMMHFGSQPEAQAEEKASFSIGEKKYIKRQMSYFERSGESKAAAQKACGYKPDINIDWPSFKPVMDKLMSREINASPWAHCAFPLDAMRNICKADEDFKKTVQKKIKSVVCHYGGPGKFVTKLDKGVLHFYVDFKATNQSKKAQDALEKLL